MRGCAGAGGSNRWVGDPPRPLLPPRSSVFGAGARGPEPAPGAPTPRPRVGLRGARGFLRLLFAPSALPEFPLAAAGGHSPPGPALPPRRWPPSPLHTFIPSSEAEGKRGFGKEGQSPHRSRWGFTDGLLSTL